MCKLCFGRRCAAGERLRASGCSFACPANNWSRLFEFDPNFLARLVKETVGQETCRKEAPHLPRLPLELAGGAIGGVAQFWLAGNQIPHPGELDGA